MTSLLLLAVLAAPPQDGAKPDGTVYRRFDAELMAKIALKNAAKRDARRGYDTKAWLPVEEEPPRPTAKSKVDDEALREVRMRMTALRKQKQYARSRTGIYRAFIPPPPCQWGWVRYGY